MLTYMSSSNEVSEVEGPVRDPLEHLAGAPREQESMSVAERLARCGTLDGTPIDPWDAARLPIGAELRRVVVGDDGAAINLSRTNRFYRSTARDAVMIRHPESVRAGCETTVAHRQADHLTPWAEGGETNSTNGTPQSGRHNRLKNHRFKVWCDPTGRWHTYRPDGTEIRRIVHPEGDPRRHNPANGPNAPTRVGSRAPDAEVPPPQECSHLALGVGAAAPTPRWFPHTAARPPQ